MPRSLRVLLVEDSEDDALLVLRELKRGDFDVHHARVDTADALRVALREQRWDVVISDFALPSFSGLDALRILQEAEVDLPFILVSGTIGEEVAVDAMKAGAHDYVMKGKLARLLPAVERELREAERRVAHREAEKTLVALRKAVDSLPVGVTITGLDGKILFTNPAEHRLHGYEPGELVGQPASILVPPELTHPLTAAQLKNLRTWKRERINVRKDGGSFSAQLISDVIKDAAGEPVGIVTICEDITDRKAVERQLFRHAFFDDLTGLPNRVLFMERLGRALARTHRRRDHVFAVLFMDLDRFKLVNDSLGHQIGDQLLVAMARRLESCVRPGDTIARLGGDEFTVLAEDVKDVAGATQVAARIQSSLAVPFPLEGHEVFTSASIGIAVSDRQYRRQEDLLRDADTAMYRAKALGKARCEVFQTGMHADAMSLLRLETDLRHAIDRGEMTCFYQPIVSLDSGRVTGFEALARWRHPQRGLVLPDAFIPLAEETGLIVPLGRAVLREACAEMAGFRNGHAYGLSVNLSARQIFQDDLVACLEEVLSQTGLAPSRLKLEITESAIMTDTDTVIQTLLELKSRGIEIHVDDFGTGYSSLSYLQRLPVDTLKIDRSFVSRIAGPEDRVDIVESIISLARSLRLEVMAEGIETGQQLARLRSLRCDQGQGYYFSRPLPAATLREFVATVPTW